MYCELVQYVQYSGGRKVLISAEKHFPLPLPSSFSLFLSFPDRRDSQNSLGLLYSTVGKAAVRGVKSEQILM